jgi:hypothetical protein
MRHNSDKPWCSHYRHSLSVVKSATMKRKERWKICKTLAARRDEELRRHQNGTEEKLMGLILLILLFRGVNGGRRLPLRGKMIPGMLGKNLVEQEVDHDASD